MKKKKKTKKKLPATILTNEIYYLSLTRKQICLFATAVTSSVNFFYTICKTKRVQFFQANFRIIEQGVIACTKSIGALFARI
jgi:hypothetical protein